jgi:hypothetical protein
MAKVILEFDSIEEQSEIDTALNGWKWKMAMWDLDQKLRGTVKYSQSVLINNTPNPTLPTDIEYDIADKYREIIREILSGYGIMLD